MAILKPDFVSFLVRLFVVTVHTELGDNENIGLVEGISSFINAFAEIKITSGFTVPLQLAVQITASKTLNTTFFTPSCPEKRKFPV
jgi:hypothetical protein